MRKGPKPRPISERFWEKVEEPFDAHNDCWLWKSGCYPNGYGKFALTRSSKILAHRFVYEFFNGPIPNGLEVHHNCENPRCQNPTHLELLTPEQHTATKRLFSIGPWNRAKTHCLHGHPFSRENTFIYSKVKRGCRQCRREAQQRSRERKRLVKARKNCKIAG